MCISFLYFTRNPNSKIKFLILFNREEFLRRSAQTLGFHPIGGQSQDYLLYPLDVPTQGTYFCLNTKNANFSFLLNNPLKSNSYNINCKLKRGSLPLEFCMLNDDENNWNNFFEKLNKEKSEYNGFNIICGNFKKKIVKYYTNNSEDIKFNAENIIENKMILNTNDSNRVVNHIYKNDFLVNDNMSYSEKFFDNALIDINNADRDFKEVINPIHKCEFERFDCNVPFELTEEKFYVVSNNFIFDSDKRVNFGGKKFKHILDKYHSLKKNEISNNGDQITDDKNTKSANEKNNASFYDELIQTIFSDLLGDKEKLENTHDEVVQILKTDENWNLNAMVDDYHSSSLFINDKIDDFYTEFGTRNSVAVLVDDEDSLKISYLDDKLKEENGRLTKIERDLGADILKMQFKL